MEDVEVLEQATGTLRRLIDEARQQSPEGDGISENVSENTEEPKRKRGRPPRFKEGYDWAMKSQYGARTQRDTQNKVYMQYGFLALSAVGDEEIKTYAWILPHGSWNFFTNRPHVLPAVNWANGLKKTILAEIGRVALDYGEEHARAIARQLCEMEPKPTTRQAVAMIRHWRMGKEDEAGNAEALFKALQRTILDYLERYPATPATVVHETLEALAWLVEPEEEVSAPENV